MILGKKPEARTLEDWLDAATEDLLPADRERVRLEIQAHHNDAVERHLAEGAPMDSAKKTALAELGPASDAANRFNNYYFTQRQQKRLNAIVRNVRDPWWLSFYCIWCVIWIAVYIANGKGLLATAAGVVLSLILIFRLVCSALEPDKLRANPTLIVLLDFTEWTILLPLLTYPIIRPLYNLFIWFALHNVGFGFWRKLYRFKAQLGNANNQTPIAS